ncbi:MAG: DUF4430 domain-containing protein [Lachnospiraceae bacterium]|nr:DUF4430 domain-containing protein [Lachnospiraceae bacterium]
MLDKIRDFIREKRNIKKIAVGAIVIITAVVIITQISIEPASVDSNQSNVSVSDDTASTSGAKSDKDNKDNKALDSSDATDKESKDESQKDESTNEKSKKDKSQTAQSQNNETQKDSTAENKPAATSTGAGNSVATGSSDNNSGNSKTQTNTSGSGSNEAQQVSEPVVVNCTVTIDCSSISGNGALTAAGNPQLEAYAANPTILSVNINVSDTNDDGRVGVDEAIKQACDAYSIQYEFKSSSYLSGMNYLYEFNAGPNSGWMYKVNGRVPNKGCNSYYLKGSEDILWYYVISY